MGRAFVKHADAETFTEFEGKTFADVLQAAKDHVADLTWQELARYNWGTAVPAEVNRILVETVGCTSIDDDPLKTAFETRLGPGGTPKILLPKPWTADALEANRTHTVRIAKRKPAPAVSITSLTPWFQPKTAKCTLQYALQGVSERADKVDFEVHASRYFTRTNGNLVEGTPHAEKGSTHLVRTRKILEVGTATPPTDPQTYDTWKGESKATQGILEDTGDVHVDFRCAPYPVMVRYYKDAGDENAKLLLEPFCPCWKKGTLDDASLVAKWSIADDQGKLEQGQLLLLDKDGTVVLRLGLSKATLRDAKQVDLSTLPTEVFDKSTLDRAKMPYRVQLQAHSTEAQDEGLAIATMHTQVRAFAYDKIQLLAFNIKPGTKNGGTQYLGKGTTDEDIEKRCEIMIEAIRLAKANAEAGTNVLKLFMAPEFYFRGEEGAYPVEKVSSIMERMLEEAGKEDYADWLFVYGTVIAYLRHEARSSSGVPTGLPTEHGETTHVGSRSHPTPPVTIDNSGEKTKVTVTSEILGSWSDRVPWVFKQAMIEEVIESRAPAEAGKLELLLASKKPGLIDAAAEIIEPVLPVVAVDHSGPKSKLTLRSPFGSRITTDVRWRVKQGAHEEVIEAIVAGSEAGDYVLTLASQNAGFVRGTVELIEPGGTVLEVDNSGPKTKLRVKAEQARRIGPKSSVVQWRIEQGGCDEAIETAVGSGPGEYWLTLAGKDTGWVTGDAKLQEPVTSEIFNIALMQRGWPCVSRCDHGLLQGLVYKEYVSPIDYLGAHFGDGATFHAVDGSGREITLHNETNRVVRPTAGSVDLLAELPNALGDETTWVDPKGESHITGSEINKSGEGGGSVLTFDEIVLGVEICLDHAQSKLHKFYNGHAKSGDPRVQVQLIPSWGMSIGGGPIVAVDQAPKYGLVFNVDGARCDSTLRVADKTYSCDDHPDQTGVAGNRCGVRKDYYVCTTCNAILSYSPGTCPNDVTHGALTRFHRCMAPVDFYVCQACGNQAPVPGNCYNGHPPQPLTHLYGCAQPLGGGLTCTYFVDPMTGTCPMGHYNNVRLCMEYWPSASGQCSHGHNRPEVCGRPMQPLGTEVTASAGPVDVPSSHDADYYEKPGHVLVYPAKDIPTPATVP